LSEVSHLDAEAKNDLAELGASPWTDTKPKPNWLSLGLGAAAFLLGALVIYGYLFTSLIEMLNNV
jgi:hypothetical protein